MMLQVFGASITFFFFAIMLETPRIYIVRAGMLGGLGWFIYLFADRMFSTGPVWASFASVMVTAVISHIAARIYKVPVTMFLVSGILPTVPGSGMYKIPYYMIMHDTEMTNHYFIETMACAGAIALAIFIVDAVFRTISDMQNEKKKLKMNEKC